MYPEDLQRALGFSTAPVVDEDRGGQSFEGLEERQKSRMGRYGFITVRHAVYKWLGSALIGDDLKAIRPAGHGRRLQTAKHVNRKSVAVFMSEIPRVHRGPAGNPYGFYTRPVHGYDFGGPGYGIHGGVRSNSWVYSNGGDDQHLSNGSHYVPVLRVLGFRKILAAFLLVISLANCGIGCTVAIEMWIFSKLSELVALQPIIEGNLGLQCAVDAIIATDPDDRSAVIMTVMFSRWRTNFFADTDKLLNRLIRTAVQSGFFPAVFALGTLLSSRFSPGTYMVSLFSLPIGRIYTHTMMDQLIAREELRDMLFNRGNHLSFPISIVASSGTSRIEASMMHTLSTASKEVRNESSNDVSKESQVFQNQ
ncbi:hypothetical protein DFH08DRAFT_992390 [Mycena albidolilacea]|uniref:DUF6534 domain-containing protein n=1 Tax=Mycena albidolilacea TaxID=1033008 RepID=A0AAD7EUL8_9AGAR|nr:hypothetical protein DFH08DRAFT_992390 [Mycena albidolilacea]